FQGLLRVKIAYQLLKKQAFEGKVRLEGFLHLATSEAEHAIATSFHAVAAFAEKKKPQEVIDACYPDQTMLSEQKTYVDKGIEKVFKTHQENKKAVNFVSPAFFTFGKHDLDIASGMVYYEGEEQQELPADFQNNPHVRSLKLHELPYVPSHNGSYVHSTEENGRRVAQIRLSSRGDDQVIIERRLNTTLGGRATMKMLKYCPLETLISIPSAVSERMGIREYWIDTRANILYGYDENETLVASISLNEQTIKTARGSFHLPNNNEELRAVQTYLSNVLPLEEVLINDVRNEVWIPSLDMTLTLGRNKEWSVRSPHVSGLIIDFKSERIPGTFVFKEDKTVQADEQLEGEIRVFELRLKKCEAKTSPSLKEKEEKELIKNRLQELKIKRAQREKRCYLSLLPRKQNPAEIRQKIAAKTLEITGFAQKMQGAQNPQERQNLQKGFVEGEKALATLKRDYYKTCSKQEVAIAETSAEGCVKGRDLADTLFLLLKSSDNKIPIDPTQWIDELSLHGENKTLNDKTFHLLYDCAQIKGLPQSLSLYLHLLLCHHNFLMLDDIAKTETRDKEIRLQETKNQYSRLKQRCAEMQQACKEELPSPVNALLAIHCNALPHQQQAAEAIHPTISSHAAQHLQGLAEQSLLERLSLATHTTPTHKNADVDIEEEQNALVKSFKNESKEQVSGFYLEEFGLFSKQALYQEFSLSGDNALFGLKQKDIDALFQALVEKKWIAQRTKTSLYYSLTEKTHHPLTCGQTADLMALLAPLPVSPENRKEIARRLKTFFFKGAHASFSYAWKDEASKQAS
ncbi:MAG: hypothetical protein KDK63_05005, partial [Chlamydiia bacterium]|nr:hypothetical protein [Chlamydiia bacterium]